MLVCGVVAMIVWGLMGTLIVRERIQAFIVTLGGMLVFKGIFWRVIENKTLPVTGPTKGLTWGLDISGQHLDVPQDWRLVGYLCIGWPEVVDQVPELQC